MEYCQVKDEHIINIDELMLSSSRSSSNCCCAGCETCEKGIKFPSIHRFERNDDAESEISYKPTIFSIGPYHLGTPTLRAAESHKWECLNYILNLNKGRKLEDYIESVKGVETLVRNSYGSEIEMDQNGFLKMLLLDGCFILVTFFAMSLSTSDELEDVNNRKDGKISINLESSQIDLNQECTHVQDSIGDEHVEADNKILYSNFSFLDLLLLENQIPFFILTKIYTLAAGESSNVSLFKGNAVKFMEAVLQSYLKITPEYNRQNEFHHLLHLCHVLFRPTELQLGDDRNDITQNIIDFGGNKKAGHESEGFFDMRQKGCRWRCAVQYTGVGIALKRREFSANESHSLLDIRFCEGMIEIPPLVVDNWIGSLFCNLIAFERTCPQFGSYITSYILFWSQLIGSRDDAALLVKNDIIANHLNSDAELCDLFIALSKGIDFDFDGDNYLESLSHVIEAQYLSQMPVWTRFLAQSDINRQSSN